MDDELKKRMDDSVNELNELVSKIKLGQAFAELAESASCPFYMGLLGSDGKWKWVNTKFAEDLGFDKSKIIGRLYTDFVAKDSGKLLDEFNKGKGKAVYTGYPAVYNMKDGQKVVEWWSTETPMNGGDMLSIGIPTGDNDKYVKFTS